ncbi:MAG: alpha/beta hydrolase [Comamonadaceae bacterium]|nr:alpha/beta hydrolase [Comamonadaceae bacterium]
MNKSRRMAALQSRALAAAGFAVLRVDLLGCGDSAGDFGDATWPRWVDDVVAAARWLRRQHPDAADAPLWLWGLRAGACSPPRPRRGWPPTASAATSSSGSRRRRASCCCSSSCG